LRLSLAEALAKADQNPPTHSLRRGETESGLLPS